MRTLILIATLLVMASPTLAQTTNEKILKFCKDHVGEKVGDGECSSLADAALKHAAAKTGFKDAPNEGDYVWGKLVCTVEMKDNSAKVIKVGKMSIQAGDVIQLRDVKFEGKSLRGNGTYNAAYPHHTAVVLAVKKNNVITILEQNYNGQKIVSENAYRLTDLKAGWIRIYRPVSQ
jgi:hypothetical protein